MYQKILLTTALLLGNWAFANCPDLTGTYTRESNGKTVYMKVVTKVENGAAVYDFEMGVDKPTWVWKSIADGKKYPKEIPRHENVEEVGTCKANVLHRRLTGDFDEEASFTLDADVSNPTPDILRIYSDFSGYGQKHVITENIYQRKK